MAGGDPASFDNKNVFQLLRQLARHGMMLGGISGGPVILAAAGLMSDRRMTVHWEHAEALAESAPALMVERTLYVLDRDRLTCAGGTAPLDMMFALISEHHGPDFAARVSDWFMHTEIRPSQGPQRAGLAERIGTTNPVIVQSIEAMENHIADPLDLQQLAYISNVGPRQLNRLFQEKIGQTTMTFYRELRLVVAQKLLTQSILTITDVALATGFSSSAHFSTAYRRKYGVRPSSVRP
jgi:transcriptional regulator GlxA family with amidase domain